MFGCTGNTVDRVFDEPDGEVKIVLDDPCGVGRSVPVVTTKYVYTLTE